MAFTIVDAPKDPGDLPPNTYAIEIPEETPERIAAQNRIKRMVFWTIVLFLASAVMMAINSLLILIFEK